MHMLTCSRVSNALVDIIAQIIVARTYGSYYQILKCHNSIIALIIARYYETTLIIAHIIAHISAR